MRIESVDAIAVDIPLTRNFGGSTYAVLKRSTVITRLRTDQGLVSEIYNGDNYAECFADPARDPVWQAMWANRPAIKDGIMTAGAGPGFGLVLDEAMVRRYRV